MKSTLALAAPGALCLTLVPRAARAHCDSLSAASHAGTGEHAH